LIGINSRLQVSWSLARTSLIQVNFAVPALPQITASCRRGTFGGRDVEAGTRCS